MAVIKGKAQGRDDMAPSGPTENQSQDRRLNAGGPGPAAFQGVYRRDRRASDIVPFFSLKIIGARVPLKKVPGANSRHASVSTMKVNLFMRFSPGQDSSITASAADVARHWSDSHAVRKGWDSRCLRRIWRKVRDSNCRARRWARAIRQAKPCTD